MSLFGAMRTSVTGLNAQSSRVSTVADNIANSSTTGYKRASAEFETLTGNNSSRNYTSGGVSTHVRYSITDQGTLQHTTSVTDLAISGNGFFVVQNANGTPYLTRAGSFVPDSNGNLVNTGGYTLMGFELTKAASSPANGLSGLTKVNINQTALVANPTTSGTFVANLGSNSAVIPAAGLPSTNSAAATFTDKTSLVSYDNLGNKVMLDVYFAKTGTNSWEAAVYDQSKAASGGGFPYTSGPMTAQALSFSSTNGTLTGGSPLSIAIPNGQTLTLDLSKTTQLAAAYAVTNANVNGNAPSALDHVSISTDGILSDVYQDGTVLDRYRIPLANVASPDNLRPVDGNVYSTTTESENILVGSAQRGGLGQINSSTLEASNVDLATELTTMIEAQRSYTANSKAFQGASDMLDVLTNIKV